MLLQLVKIKCEWNGGRASVCSPDRCRVHCRSTKL